ncbi:nucleoside 2-deoxyribosyltransferase [Leptospira sarikeiensis]|uniref:Nucleoside 2-deoxyribosyltransferase n=1 Tax=Leptospira sarikeiensis TaxID=2484943 RepID=A0A4R9KD77_9LEPT|nr:nucleoside 2-deoxyribosyltransferase [Leptospira sarikeiensis]TGL64086.1 nucleoside 2-deoxyribosyltransferase [Leptospira sarikeiensis]
MKYQKSIYLAGPEVFLPNAIEVLGSRKRTLEEQGFIVYSPFDGDVEAGSKRDLFLAKRIFEENCKLIRQSDLVLANCDGFRGVCIDDGTSFEIGYAYSLGKRIYGYRGSDLILPKDVESKLETFPHPSGYKIDPQGYLLNEDFGNKINLMLEFSISGSGGELFFGTFESILPEFINAESGYD